MRTGSPPGIGTRCAAIATTPPNPVGLSKLKNARKPAICEPRKSMRPEKALTRRNERRASLRASTWRARSIRPVARGAADCSVATNVCLLARYAFADLQVPREYEFLALAPERGTHQGQHAVCGNEPAEEREQRVTPVHHPPCSPHRVDHEARQPHERRDWDRLLNKPAREVEVLEGRWPARARTIEDAKVERQVGDVRGPLWPRQLRLHRTDIFQEAERIAAGNREPVVQEEGDLARIPQDEQPRPEEAHGR